MWNINPKKLSIRQYDLKIVDMRLVHLWRETASESFRNYYDIVKNRVKNLTKWMKRDNTLYLEYGEILIWVVG